jgi:predicted aspartyl protease
MRIPYSEDLEPPCPVLAVRVAAPPDGAGIGVVAVVDTGADVTLIPEAAARLLGLPAVSEIRITGVTGVAETADVCAAVMELAGHRGLAEVVAFGSEAIVGRDLLSRFVLRLDGPRQVMDIAAARKRGRKRILRRRGAR